MRSLHRSLRHTEVVYYYFGFCFIHFSFCFLSVRFKPFQFCVLISILIKFLYYDISICGLLDFLFISAPIYYVIKCCFTREFFLKAWLEFKNNVVFIKIIFKLLFHHNNLKILGIFPIGVTIDYFHSSGNIPVFKDLLII